MLFQSQNGTIKILSSQAPQSSLHLGFNLKMVRLKFQMNLKCI